MYGKLRSQLPNYRSFKLGLFLKKKTASFLMTLYIHIVTTVNVLKLKFIIFFVCEVQNMFILYLQKGCVAIINIF
jgi:hypothetical protein